MQYEITIDRPWRYRDPKRGRQQLSPGTYRVPEDIADPIANLAVAEGMATRRNYPMRRPGPLEFETKKAEVKPVSCIKFEKRWDDFCIVAGSGPSLTPEVAEACRGYPVVAVNDAYRLLPFAAALYAGDEAWWNLHEGAKGFAGERWSSHDIEINPKIECAKRFDLKLVKGANRGGFSTDPNVIHYGGNSGFQGVNIAAHGLGWKGRIALVGFDMKPVNGRRHFFGDHPPELKQTKNGYKQWPAQFKRAAEMLPAGIEIVNCTPGSALTCFPTMSLADAHG